MSKSILIQLTLKFSAKIIKLQQYLSKEKKESIHKFKEFWHSIMGHFHKRICYDKDNTYKIVMFTMAKLMEMESTEQNKIALYLFNKLIV